MMQCTVLLLFLAATKAHYVLYINLLQSTARREHMEHWLQLSPASWRRLEAIDSRELASSENKTELTMHVKSIASNCNLQLHTWSIGVLGGAETFGCALSHVKAIAVAYAMGLKSALIMEDDMHPIPLLSDSSAEIWRYLEQLLASLPAGWKVTQLATNIFNLHKIEEVRAAVTEDILWSLRDSCSSTDFMLWGAGAYVISREGMREFLSRHAPSMLTATVQQAEQMCVTIDARASTTSTTADYWVYDRSDVYYSHIPLFAPAEAIAALSTIQVSGVLSAMPSLQLEAVAASVGHLKHRGILSPSMEDDQLQAALSQTQKRHLATRLRSTGKAQYVLIVDLSIDSFHSHVASFTSQSIYAVYNITAGYIRQQLHDKLAIESAPLAAFWHTMVNSYFSKCRAAALPHHGLAGEWLNGVVHVLIPLDLQLKTFTVPTGASRAHILQIASRFCQGFRGTSTRRDNEQCVSVLVNCMSDALALTDEQ
jgi:GR25 family glycosyltransferase involved in LPS biosynthesis